MYSWLSLLLKCKLKSNRSKFLNYKRSSEFKDIKNTCEFKFAPGSPNAAKEGRIKGKAQSSQWNSANLTNFKLYLFKILFLCLILPGLAGNIIFFPL